MPAPHATTPQWQQRLKEGLARNKKQTFVLGALVLFGLVIGVRMLSKKPASAKADASVAALPTGKGPLSAMASAGAPAAHAERDEYIRRISHDIARDLFEFHADLYPLVRPPQPSLPVPTAAPGHPPGQATEELVRMRAAELELQSTIDSEIPVAVINGRVLAVDDTMDGFRVVEIHSGACVVEQAGVQVRLEMPPD